MTTTTAISMDIQRLRNLTTHKLHTEMKHIYEDLEAITGIEGLMTYMLPRACDACTPWLVRHVTDERFWDDKFDESHVGTIELPTPSEIDRKEMRAAMWGRP